MFKFNMLSPGHWEKLQDVHLHGLPGLAFGVLILATLPIYFATIAQILKNNKTPIPLPFCTEKTPVQKQDADLTNENSEPEVKIPPGLPREMIGPYMRIAHGDAKKHSDYELAVIDDAPAPEKPAPSAEPATPYIVPAKEAGHEHAIPNLSQSIKDDAEASFPIPTDFDFDDAPESSAPVFKEISFGDNKGASSQSRAGDPAAQPRSENAEIENELIARGFKTELREEIIIAEKESGKFAIAIHDSPDFWIADDDIWFAEGKQKSSPIKALLEFAVANDATPVLYLKESNIMNLPDMQKNWDSAGVRVILSASDL
ncbi:MAG: hypothetical protein LBK26_03500 [Rickettsiales bacterium]|nr:hypothetical protein [Rickettsiales bacterium]